MIFQWLNQRATARTPWVKGYVENLPEAWRRVKASGGAPGVDGQTIRALEQNRQRALDQIRQEILKGRYRFDDLRNVEIAKEDGGVRCLEIPTVRDRIVLQTIRLNIEPLVEPSMPSSSFAFRQGRSAVDAVKTFQKLKRSEAQWVLKSDIRSFFDSIVHARLLQKLKPFGVPAGDGLLNRAIKQTSGTGRSKTGLAQGSPLSPLLANTYLLEFDQDFTAGPCRLIRYADDMLIVGKNQEQCKRALRDGKRHLKRIGLKFHPAKTNIYNRDQTSFDFLGFQICPDGLRPSRRNADQALRQLRKWMAVRRKLDWEKRCQRVNSVLQSFGSYFSICDQRAIFEEVDTEVTRLWRCLRKGAHWAGDRNDLLRLFPNQSKKPSWASSKQRSKSLGRRNHSGNRSNWSGYPF